MKRKRAWCGVVALAAMCVGAAGAQQPAPADAKGGTATQSSAHPQTVDVLSDTQGVDFNPYVRDILKQIREQWVKLMPQEARTSQLKQGVTDIRFTIDPDGTLVAMHLDGSAQDQALDRAAWGSITGVGHFPPLPKEFHGPHLEMRVHFHVNG